MLGLPKATELKKPLAKTAIYEKFHMTPAAKEKFDSDVSRITIVNEISPATTAIAKGETVSAFFVLHISLKKNNFDEKNIGMIARLVNQKIVFILEYEDQSKLAVYRTKLLQTDGRPIEEWKLLLKGLNLDAVWENVILQIGDIEVKQGNTLDEQISLNEKRQKLQKQIETLERKARKEPQHRKKFELVQAINKLKKELEKYNVR